MLKHTQFVPTSDTSADIVFTSKDGIFAQSLEKLGKLEAIRTTLCAKAGKDVELAIKIQTAETQSPASKVEKALEDFLSKDKIEIV